MALRADLDLAFLARDDLRPVRLLLEYLKPELTLRDRGIDSTVVVFGSTRLCQPDEAARRVAAARAELAARPEDRRRAARVLACERLEARSRYYEVAREFGRRAAERPFTIATGGGPGIMEAANRGASEAGAESIGLNITIPDQQAPNSWASPELSFEFRYFAIRKLHFVLRARALVAFPGGFGTLDELFDVLTLVQTGRQQPLPMVLVGREFWARAVDFDFLTAEGFIDAADLDQVHYAESASEILSILDAATAPRASAGSGSSPA